MAPRLVGICATDAELLAGTMPYIATGHAGYPLQPGHEWTGVVLESVDPLYPPGLRVIGDPVVGCGQCPECTKGPATHCPFRFEMGVRGGMPGACADVVAVPKRNLVRIPAEMPDEAAVFTEPCVTVLAGLDRVRVFDKMQALVIGNGTIGLIATSVLVASGAEVSVGRRTQRRDALIEKVGGIPVQADAQAGLHDRFALVIEAAGSEAAVWCALDAVAPGGDVVLLGVPKRPVDKVNLAAIVTKDATIHGVLNGPGRYLRAIEVLSKDLVLTQNLVDAIYPMTAAQAAFDRFNTQGRESPKVLIEIGSQVHGA